MRIPFSKESKKKFSFGNHMFEQKLKEINLAEINSINQ